MNGSTVRAALVGVVACAALAATSGAAGASTGRPLVRVHTASGHTVTGPSSLQPGVVRIGNTGRNAIFVIERKRAGVHVLVRDLNAQQSGPGHLISDFTLLEILDPGRSVYLQLHRGTFYLADAELDTYSTAQIKTISVQGRPANAVPPVSAPVVVDGHNALHGPDHLVRKPNLHVVNRSGNLQELVLFGIGASTKDATVRDFLAHPGFDKIYALNPTSFEIEGILGAHRALWLHSTATQGRYVLITLALRPSSTQPGMHSTGVRLITVG